MGRKLAEGTDIQWKLFIFIMRFPFKKAMPKKEGPKAKLNQQLHNHPEGKDTLGRKKTLRPQIRRVGRVRQKECAAHSRLELRLAGEWVSLGMPSST